MMWGANAWTDQMFRKYWWAIALMGIASLLGNLLLNL